jgi:AbiJ N-terminal domain 4
LTKDTEERKKLTFEQAEGVQPLPSQLQLREVSQQLRAVLWNQIHRYLSEATEHSDYGPNYIDKPWSMILKEEHVYRQHGMVDDFGNVAKDLIAETRDIFENGDYLSIFGWLEFVLKHPACPSTVADDVERILRYCRAAYRVIDRKVICPVASDTEHSTIVQAFADLGAKQFNGARAHLRNAASHLTAGAYADSVRESIHAVEAVGRTLDPTADVLSKALAKLEQKISIYPAMKKGFTSLYAYTSDEKGIRHALLDDSAAKVDEADALFMLGACAAFVSYLVNKARSSGLL